MPTATQKDIDQLDKSLADIRKKYKNDPKQRLTAEKRLYESFIDKYGQTVGSASAPIDETLRAHARLREDVEKNLQYMTPDQQKAYLQSVGPIGGLNYLALGSPGRNLMAELTSVNKQLRNINELAGDFSGGYKGPGPFEVAGLGVSLSQLPYFNAPFNPGTVTTGGGTELLGIDDLPSAVAGNPMTPGELMGTGGVGPLTTAGTTLPNVGGSFSNVGDLTANIGGTEYPIPNDFLNPQAGQGINLSQGVLPGDLAAGVSTTIPPLGQPGFADAAANIVDGSFVTPGGITFGTNANLPNISQDTVAAPASNPPQLAPKTTPLPTDGGETGELGTGNLVDLLNGIIGGTTNYISGKSNQEFMQGILDYMKGFVTSPDDNPFVQRALKEIDQRTPIEDSPFYQRAKEMIGRDPTDSELYKLATELAGKDPTASDFLKRADQLAGRDPTQSGFYQNALGLGGRDPNTAIFQALQNAVTNPASILGAGGPYGALADYYTKAAARKAASQGNIAFEQNPNQGGALNEGALQQIMGSLSRNVAPLLPSTINAYGGAYGAEQNALNALMGQNLQGFGAEQNALNQLLQGNLAGYNAEQGNITDRLNAITNAYGTEQNAYNQLLNNILQGFGTEQTAQSNRIRDISSGIAPYQSQSAYALGNIPRLAEGVASSQSAATQGIGGGISDVLSALKPQTDWENLFKGVIGLT